MVFHSTLPRHPRALLMKKSQAKRPRIARQECHTTLKEILAQNMDINEHGRDRTNHVCAPLTQPRALEAPTPRRQMLQGSEATLNGGEDEAMEGERRREGERGGERRGTVIGEDGERKARDGKAGRETGGGRGRVEECARRERKQGESEKGRRFNGASSQSEENLGSQPNKVQKGL